MSDRSMPRHDNDSGNHLPDHGELITHAPVESPKTSSCGSHALDVCEWRANAGSGMQILCAKAMSACGKT
jgi:hypothetical protein